MAPCLDGHPPGRNCIGCFLSPTTTSVLLTELFKTTDVPTRVVQYSSPSLIRTSLLPSNYVLIREVSFGKREYYIHSWYLLPRICGLSRRGDLYSECPLKERLLYRACLHITGIFGQDVCRLPAPPGVHVEKLPDPE